MVKHWPCKGAMLIFACVAYSYLEEQTHSTGAIPGARGIDRLPRRAGASEWRPYGSPGSTIGVPVDNLLGFPAYTAAAPTLPEMEPMREA